MRGDWCEHGVMMHAGVATNNRAEYNELSFQLSLNDDGSALAVSAKSRHCLSIVGFTGRLLNQLS